MPNSFYYGIYKTKEEADVRAQVLKQRGYKVEGPNEFVNGAVDYSEASDVKNLPHSTLEKLLL